MDIELTDLSMLDNQRIKFGLHDVICICESPWDARILNLERDITNIAYDMIGILLLLSALNVKVIDGIGKYASFSYTIYNAIIYLNIRPGEETEIRIRIYDKNKESGPILNVGLILLRYSCEEPASKLQDILFDIMADEEFGDIIPDHVFKLAKQNL